MLSKTVCKSCYRSQSKTWRQHHEQWWEKGHEIKGKVVLCPCQLHTLKSQLIPTHKQPPAFCRHILEHIVLGEEIEESAEISH